MSRIRNTTFKFKESSDGGGGGGGAASKVVRHDTVASGNWRICDHVPLLETIVYTFQFEIGVDERPPDVHPAQKVQ